MRISRQAIGKEMAYGRLHEVSASATTIALQVASLPAKDGMRTFCVTAIIDKSGNPRLVFRKFVDRKVTKS